jgi:hypothetical protein
MLQHSAGRQPRSPLTAVLGYMSSESAVGQSATQDLVVHRHGSMNPVPERWVWEWMQPGMGRAWHLVFLSPFLCIPAALWQSLDSLQLWHLRCRTLRGSSGMQCLMALQMA